MRRVAVPAFGHRFGRYAACLVEIGPANATTVGCQWCEATYLPAVRYGDSGGALERPLTQRSKVAYANGQYVMLGSREYSAESARGFVLSSTDARNWKLVHQRQDERLVSITHTGDAWYTAGAVGQNSKATTLLLRSEDGIVWDRATPPVAAVVARSLLDRKAAARGGA